MGYYPSQEKRWIEAQQQETLRHTLRDKSQFDRLYISITSRPKWLVVTFQLKMICVEMPI